MKNQEPRHGVVERPDTSEYRWSPIAVSAEGKTTILIRFKSHMMIFDERQLMHARYFARKQTNKDSPKLEKKEVAPIVRKLIAK